MRKFFLLFVIFLQQISFAANFNYYIVSSKGDGNYSNVQAAIDACPDNVRSYIFIKNGTYYGQTTIGSKAASSLKLITLIGENKDSVILTFDKSLNSDGVTSFEQATTFQIYAKNFYAENITFQNSAGNTGQALALYTAGDMSIFKNCYITGYQDTYRSKKGTRGYILNCLVEGAVDFIYAGGTLIFDDCIINCTRSGGFITAPEDAYATVPKTSTATGIFLRLGFVFRNCTIQGPESVSANSFYLGRPWNDYAGTAYLNCKLSNQVSTAGWSTMGSSTYLTACFVEYNSMDLSGVPVDTTKRVSWSKQLKKSDVDNFLSPEAFYAKNYSTTFDPVSLCIALAAPTEVSINGNMLKWTAVNGAVCYMVYFNDNFIGVTENLEFDISGLSGIFKIKALSDLGVLSDFSTPVTGIKNIQSELPDFSLVNQVLVFKSEMASAEIFDLTGKKLLSKNNFSTLNLKQFSNNILLVQTVDYAGNVKEFKLKVH